MKTFDRLILVVALCLGLSMVRGTTQPVLAAGEAISGVVTDAIGKPLANITVTVYRYFSDLAPAPAWAPTAYGYTDETGAYMIPVFEPATYRVGFADPGFYAEFYNNAATVEAATDVIVESGKTTTSIDAVLAAKASISGVVTDLAGNPVQGFDVIAYQDAAGDGSWQIVGTLLPVHTNSAGHYSFGGLEAGTYRVGFMESAPPERYYPEFYHDAATVEAATDIVVAQGAQISGIDAQLTPKGRIRGVIIDPDGKPAPNIMVTVYEDVNKDGVWQSMLYGATAVTAMDGAYEIGGLEVGVYRVGFVEGGTPRRFLDEFYDNAATVESATDIPVAVSQIVEHIDAQLMGAGHITGMVTDADGNPVSGLHVTALQFDATTGHWVDVLQWFTDDAGHYDLFNLLPGVYRVRFADPVARRYLTEYYADSPDAEHATDITVGAGEIVSGINVQLAFTGRITGHVTDPAGNPLPGILVQVVQAGQGQFGVYTDVNGGYTLAGFETGIYHVRFSADFPPPHYVTEYYDNAPDEAHATPIAMVTGQIVRDINAQLAPVDQPPGQAKLTIVKDAVPNSQRNFRFAGDLGQFWLKDTGKRADAEDGDAPQDYKQVSVAPGRYTVNEQVNDRWYLADIRCDSRGNTSSDLALGLLNINAVGGDQVTCTFVNHKFAIVRTRVYHDGNGDGKRYREPALAGWPLTVYDAFGAVVTTGVSNQFGKANFNTLRAGQYAVCETLLNGWYNTQPSILDSLYGQPCYTFNLEPGESAEVYFGNNTAPAVNSAQADQSNGLLIYPATADDDNAEGDAVYVDQDLNTPVQEDFLYLPLITR